MTLLVAGCRKSGAWMVADTAITGPTMATRSRQYMIKVSPIQETNLLGFAGDPVVATQTILNAQKIKKGQETVRYLLQAHLNHRQTDFMYAYIENSTPHLFQISDGQAVESLSAHIGMHEAFSQFQKIKHARTLDPAPDALELLLSAVVGEEPENEDECLLFSDVESAVIAMQKLFYQTNEREVGGTAIPYIATPNGVRLLNYAYSVTDPVLKGLLPGSLVPQGSAQLGGYSISVTELEERDGIVIYWLQRPGGTVWIKSDQWYRSYYFPGAPSIFKESVKENLDRDISLWFGEASEEPPQSVRVLKDEAGRPRLTLVQSGRSVSFSWMQNSEDDFRVAARKIKIVDAKQTMKNGIQNRKIAAVISEDKSTAILTVANGNSESKKLEFSSEELDELINHLARTRAEMIPQVSTDLQEGMELVTQIDPAWRTRPMLHPQLPGELLFLRHTGLGWLAFLLPPNEAEALGKYLIRNSVKE